MEKLPAPLSDRIAAMFARAVFLLIFASTAAPAQTASLAGSTFQQALLQARSPVVLQDGKLSGAGAALLEDAIRPARFIMLGEEHFSREIPLFAEALCDMIHPDAYAVEVGPFAAQFVNGLVSNPDRLKIMAERNRAFPNNMAFLDIREENDLAARCATASRNPYFAIWGLDQEFFGAAGTLLAAMAESHPGPVASAAISAAQTKDRAAEAEARRTGDYGKLFLQAATDQDMQSLEQAISKDGNQQCVDLLQEFAVSRKIYRLNEDGAAAESGLLRAQLLKRHFLDDYTAFRKQVSSPRIFFKLGDNHTEKGFNYTHELNLGNFVAELASGEGSQSLHIFALGARGKEYSFDGYGKPLGQHSFLLSGNQDYGWTGPAIANLLPQQTGRSGITFTLFDLRQLRFRALDLPPGWDHVIYSYDIFVLVPDLTVASVIQ